MGRINRLDEHISNMIAAGEVVERPAGVIKELVENCIDAQATRIEIQIAQGGIDSMIIIDDGVGMDKEDALIAFERHATSKLKDESDLWNIHTMGFRGEALPSIAAVAHVILRTNNGSDSTEVDISYGSLVGSKAIGSPKGTYIEIKGLFQKTPARFKHLKSPQYEFSLLSDIVQKFALSHPEISFCLTHDGRSVFETKGSNNLQEVLMQIYGREIAKTAIKIDASDIDYHITGYAIQPNFNRATKYYILLYINERMVRSYRLQKAIMDAYSPYMPKDRYPITILNIEMDAQLVDVNVHPSKWEIRLSKEKQLEKLVFTSIEDALRQDFKVVQTSVKKEKEKLEIPQMEFTYERDQQVSKLHEEVNNSFTKEVLPSLDMEQIRKAMMEPIPQKVTEVEVKREHLETKIQYPQTARPIIKKLDKDDVNSENLPISLEDSVISQSLKEVLVAEEPKPNIVKTPVLMAKEEKAVNACLPQMEVIGQFHNCYILTQGEAGLYIVDQHAAQERYHFEVISKQILLGNNDVQSLLLPLTIDASLGAITQIDSLNDAFASLGIGLELFGDTAFVVRELPTWMSGINEKKFIEDLIDIWMRDQEVDEEKLRKHAIATMACHSSIRFNRSLSFDEMQQVIRDLGKCEQPFHCPHGRPTFICMSDKQLIKEFER